MQAREKRANISPEKKSKSSRRAIVFCRFAEPVDLFRERRTIVWIGSLVRASQWNSLIATTPTRFGIHCRLSFAHNTHESDRMSAKNISSEWGV